MSSWNVFVGPVGNQRFCVWLLDFNGIDLMAEDRGPGQAGYTEPELRETLADAYGLSAAAIDALLYVADRDRSGLAVPGAVDALPAMGA